MELENAQNGRKKRRSPAITLEQRQEFYRLHYAEGMMLKTIAEKFGVSFTTVTSNIAKFAAEIKTARTIVEGGETRKPEYDDTLSGRYARGGDGSVLEQSQGKLPERGCVNPTYCQP